MLDSFDYQCLAIIVVLLAACFYRARRAKKHDPVYACRLYDEIGCSHVDGPLCDFPKCSMLKEYYYKDMHKQMSNSSMDIKHIK